MGFWTIAFFLQPQTTRYALYLCSTARSSPPSQSVVSLNGYRVTAAILNLVPNPKTFRSVLRAIKHWAKVRSPSLRVLQS